MSQAIVASDYDGGDSGAADPFDAYSASEMAVRLEDLSSRLTVVQEFFNRVMVKNQDYDVIPGTDKPALLKPGAEKLCELYGYAPMVKHVDEERDISSGFYHCRVTVALISKKSGESVAEGTGSANTHESRYRWRWVWPCGCPPSKKWVECSVNALEKPDAAARPQAAVRRAQWKAARFRQRSVPPARQCAPAFRAGPPPPPPCRG